MNEMNEQENPAVGGNAENDAEKQVIRLAQVMCGVRGMCQRPCTLQTNCLVIRYASRAIMEDYINMSDLKEDMENQKKVVMRIACDALCEFIDKMYHDIVEKFQSEDGTISAELLMECRGALLSAIAEEVKKREEL